MFPAPAGMAREKSRQRITHGGVPRASGDGPYFEYPRAITRECSPRQRGWPVVTAAGTAAIAVFPAPAGMARSVTRLSVRRQSVPRASGDGPYSRGPVSGYLLCSPRQRGWPVIASHESGRYAVFPAPAGMARSSLAMPLDSDGVPRASGDGPMR